MYKNARPLAIGLTVLGALARLGPHAPNFAAVGALSLFAGARLRGWKAYLLPLALMAATDPFVGGYTASTPLVYASLMLCVWIGSLLRNTENPLWIGVGSVAGSLQFFLVTNCAWLYTTTMYPHNLAGLGASYVAGIPFLGRTLASDLLCAAAVFGAHALLSRTVAPAERVAPQPA